MGLPLPGARGNHLEELARPERVAEIRAEHERRVERMRGRQQVNPLRPDAEPLDIDDLYGKAKFCLACHK